MWDTPVGIRKLQGAEHRLFIIGLLTQLEYLKVDPEGDWFVSPLMSQVSEDDRPYVFLDVAEHLLDEGPPPELMAWNETAVFEVFEELAAMVDLEIDAATEEPDVRDHFFTRQAVIEAASEAAEPGEGFQDIPDVAEDDAERWRDELDLLANRILWDLDFLDYEFFADLEPEEALMIKERTGIKSDYYAATPPGFQPEERERLELLWERLSAEEEAWRAGFLRTGRLA